MAEKPVINGRKAERGGINSIVSYSWHQLVGFGGEFSEKVDSSANLACPTRPD